MAALLGIVFFALGMGYLATRLVQIFRVRYASYEDRYLATTADQLDSLFVFITPEGLLRMSLTGGSAGCVAGAMLGAALGPLGIMICSAVFGGIGFFTPRMVITIMVQVRKTRFLKQLPDALEVLCKGLKAGLSVMQGLQLVASEMPDPVAQEFGLLVKDIQLGRSMPEAMSMLYRRITLPEVRLVVLAVSLSRRLGGDLTEALSAVAQTVRNRFNIERKIKALTAEARMQAVVVCLLPFFLFVVFWFINPEMMKPMKSLAGVAVLAVVSVLELLGGLMMWRLSKVKY